MSLIKSMFQNKSQRTSPIFRYYSPATCTCLGILSIPHSGEYIPEDFHAYLNMENPNALNEDVDYKVDKLIDIEKLRNQGIAILIAKIHRAAVDLNRPKEKSLLFWEKNTKGIPLKKASPDIEQSEELITKFYVPYYETLNEIFRDFTNQYPNKKIPFIDLHSMPARPTEYHLMANPNQKMERPDFCLSDLKGKSCEREYIQLVSDCLTRKGYSPACNDPYFGGYVIQYAHEYPTNAIQIEINREIYMDKERRTLLGDKCPKVNADLTETLLETFEKFRPDQNA